MNKGYFFKGPLLVMLAAMLWGTTGTSQALAGANTTPQTIGAMRLAVGSLALLAFVSWRGEFRKKIQLFRWPLWLAGFGVASYQLFFFEAVAQTGVAIGTIFAIGSAPLFAGVVNSWQEKERLGIRWWVSTILAVAGAGLLISARGEIQVDLVGIFLAMGAGAAYVLMAFASKRAMESHSPDVTMAIVFSLGAVFLLPILFGGDLTWVLVPSGWLAVLHLGVLATAVSYILYARGMQNTGAATATTLSLMEPLTAAVLGVTVLGEKLTLTALIGIGMVLLGLVIISGESKE